MRDKDILIGQILETDNIIGSKYLQFLENAINMGNNSKYILVDFPATLLQNNRFGKAKMDHKSLYNLLNPTLYRMNRLLIDKNDFELFKYEIDHFIKFQVLESPTKIREEIKHELSNFENGLYFNEFKIETDNEIESKLDYLQFLVKYKLFRNFQCYHVFELEIKSLESYLIDKIDDSLIDDIEEHKKQISFIIDGSEEIIWGIRPNLYELYVNSLVYKTFFMIGAYIIFSSRHKGINGAKYIKELWFHSKPTDENVTTYVVSNLVSFDAFWLINLYLFGLSDDESWLDWPKEFDDFHEARPYLIQYFLLCLTNTDKINIFPDIDKLMELEPSENLDELRECYDLSNRFYFKRHELISNLEKLIDESEVWDDVLSYKEIENGEEKLVSAKDIFLKTKSELNEIIVKLVGIIALIEKLLPLDTKKISDTINRISESYSRSSNVLNIFSREYNEDEDSEREFTEIIQKNVNPEKSIVRGCFIKSSFYTCILSWIDIGKAISSKEFEYFNNEILKNGDIPRYSSKSNLDAIYESIVTATETINEKYNPDLILIPVEIFINMRRDTYRPNTSIFGKVTGKNLLVNDLKLKVINSPYFKDIIIMDSNFISLIYKVNAETKEKIFVEIKEIEGNLPEVDVISKIFVNMELINPDGIRIITIKD